MKKFFIKYSIPIGIAGILICIILFATNAFYELVIPVFEKSSLEGSAFTFWDDFVFYFPMMLLPFFIAYIVLAQVIGKKNLENAIDKETIETHEKNAKTLADLEDKRDWLKKKLYNNCPNCGSARAEKKTHCVYCGQDLEIK